MDREQIKEVIQDVFGPSLKPKVINGWVSIRCPLAPWKHEKGHDNSPSAGISIDPDGPSGFNCFTCHTKGSFSYMLSLYADYSGEDLGSIVEEVEQGEFLGPVKVPSYDDRFFDEQDVLMPIDEDIYMEVYDSAADHAYLRSRAISPETAERLELLFDPEDPEDGEPRILFPVRGSDGLLYGFSGRATREAARLKVRDYYGLKKASLVLGAHLAAEFTRVVVVEGLVDYAAVHEMGECGLAVMHSTMTEEQADIIADIGLPTFLLYDNDKAGRDGTGIAQHRLEGRVPLFVCTYPRVKIEDNSEKGWHWLKDPGEMNEEELKATLADARLI